MAAYLLEHGLEGMQGVVYFDDVGRHMVLMRGSNEGIQLDQCGIEPSERFTFFNQTNATGTDCPQVMDARAAVTLGKDMTLRELAQGSWRMRGLGVGQTLTVLVVPEVSRLVRRAAHADKSDKGSGSAAAAAMQMLGSAGASASRTKPEHIVTWLLAASIRSEQLQHMQLCAQRMSFVWRRQALRNLVSSRHPAGGYGYSCGDLHMETLVLKPREGPLRTRFRYGMIDSTLDNHELHESKAREKREAHEKEMEKEAALRKRGLKKEESAESDAKKKEEEEKAKKAKKMGFDEEVPEVTPEALKAA